jgi:hypothetical protein
MTKILNTLLALFILFISAAAYPKTLEEEFPELARIRLNISIVNMPIQADGSRPAPHNLSIFPFAIEQVKDYFDGEIRESSYICSLNEKSVLRQPSDIDCRRWTAQKVNLGTVLMDSVTYSATKEGLIKSEFYTRSSDCASTLEGFLELQSRARMAGPLKAVYLPWDKSGSIELIVPDGADDYKYLVSLEIKQQQCTLIAIIHHS